MLLPYPVRFGSIVYFVTEKFLALYKYNKNTGKYCESKTTYKECLRREHAISKTLNKLKIPRDASWRYYRCYGWNDKARIFLKTA